MMLKIIKNSCGWLSRKLNVVAYLTAENLALRQQFIVFGRNQTRPKLKERDRPFWVVMSRVWSGRRDVLLIVNMGRLHMPSEWPARDLSSV